MKTSIPEAAPRPTSLRRNRDFMMLWSGQLVSNVGTNASGIAFPLLVLYLTGSPVQAGLVGAVQRLPFLFLVLPAGVLVDRWDRRRVMMLCDLARAIAFAAIPISAATGHLDMALIYVVVLVEGTAFSFFNLAETSSLPQVVGTEQLPAATAQNQISYAVGTLIGPPIAGVLYGIGRSLPFLADAVSYAVSVAALSQIRTRLQGERVNRPKSIRHDMAEGLSWLWQQPLIRYMAVLTGGYNVLTAGAPLVVIVLARQELHAGAGAIGLTFGLAAVGGIVGAVLGARIQRRLSFGQAIILVSWLVTVVWVSFALAPNMPAVAVIGFFLFLVFPTYDIVQFSYRLALIPDALQGRVNSMFRLVAMGGIPAGQALAGVLLEWVGPRASILALGGGFVLLGCLTTFNREVRRAPPVHEARLAVAQIAEPAVEP